MYLIYNISRAIKRCFHGQRQLSLLCILCEANGEAPDHHFDLVLNQNIPDAENSLNIFFLVDLQFEFHSRVSLAALTSIFGCQDVPMIKTIRSLHINYLA